MRTERSAPRTAPNTTTASTARAPRRRSVDPTPPSPEKKSVSRMMAPKSAMDADATMSCPKGDEISPVSFSTGTMTPSEVAHRMIATSSGVSTSPAADIPKPTITAIAKETTNASAVRRRTGPRSFSNSISRPARKSTKPRPISAMTSIAWSTSTRPRIDGPTTMPATISSTTDGSRTRGKRPRRNGAAKATATTMRRLLNDGMPSGPAARRCVTSSDRRERLARQDLGSRGSEDKRLLSLRAGNRRVPRKGLTGLDHVIRAGRSDQLARPVAREAALVVKAPLIGEARIGIEAAAVRKGLGQSAPRPCGLLAHAREDLVARAQAARQLGVRFLELDYAGQVRVEPP